MLDVDCESIARVGSPNTVPEPALLWTTIRIAAKEIPAMKLAKRRFKFRESIRSISTVFAQETYSVKDSTAEICI